MRKRCQGPDANEEIPMHHAHIRTLTARSLLVTTSLLGMPGCNSILGIGEATCTGACNGGLDSVVEEALPAIDAAAPYDPGRVADTDASVGTPAPEGSPTAAGESTSPAADEGATPPLPAGESTSPPAGESTSPPAEENTPPPAGENMPPPEPQFELPALGAASTFAVLAASTTTCTASSAFTGDVGVSPGTAVTGFNPSCTLSGALHAGDAVAAVARAAAIAASGSVASLACEHDLTGRDLGGQTLEPGVYCFDSSALLTGRLTLDGGGRTDAAWAFQIGSSMITATNSSVVMVGGASACDVFWNVGSSITLGTGTAFEGNVLATTSITLGTGSSVTGRVLALNAAVTSVANQVGGCSN
jgi:hypothetical protein